MLIRYPYKDQWYELESTELKKTPNGRNILDFYNQEYVPNPLSYFRPHGLAWSAKKRPAGDTGHFYEPADYPQEWDNDGAALCNDRDHDLVMLVAPSKTGKSHMAAASVMYRSIPCDKDWHCFQYHHVKWYPWDGPKLVRIFSFEWRNVADVWKRYRELIPRKELGKYAPRWGKYEGEKGKGMNIEDALKAGRAKDIELACGTVLSFNCYSQGDTASEGYEVDIAHFDEQPDKGTWNGYLRGSQTRGDYTPALFSMTPRVLRNRPADTGAAGFVFREVVPQCKSPESTLTMIQLYLSVEATPDAIVSVRKKRASFDRWVNPKFERDDKDTREGLARHYGIPEVGGGSVIDNYFPQHHLIPLNVLDMENKIVMEATKYRGMDHGRNRPMACSWGMVFPWGQLLIYREYYQPGKIISYHAKQIVEMSGNKRVTAGNRSDQDSGEVFKLYDEVFVREHFEASVMDSRSFATGSDETNRTLGEVYQDWGLECHAAKGNRNDVLVPQMRVWFALNEKEEHMMHHFWKRKMIPEDKYREWLSERGGVWWNAPKIYFLVCLRKTREQLVLWVNDPKTGKPRAEDDHIPGGSLKYMIAEDPQYSRRQWLDGKHEGDPWGEREADNPMEGRSFVPRG